MMNLRYRLTYLLVTFAAFAVLSATVTIYAVNLQIADVIDGFVRSLDETDQVYYLRRMAREQVLQLDEIVDRRRTVSATYIAEREAFFGKFRRVARLLLERDDKTASESISFVARKLEASMNRCLELVESNEIDQARELLNTRIKDVLLNQAVSRLRGVERRLGDTRTRSVSGLVATTKKVLVVTVVIGVFGATLVVAGAALVRRWLFVPLMQLQEATEKFSDGDFGYRTALTRADELGRLGTALNTMAQSVSDAQQQLSVSETKHRSLFENLRDAVVIVDVAGTVVECHDGDSRLLRIDGDQDVSHATLQNEPVGRHILDVWPEWRRAVPDWTSLIKEVIRGGRRYQDVDVELGPENDDGRQVVVDLIVYGVEYGDVRRAVVVLRDVTERHRLETRLRRAETTEAIGTLAGGLAHDFNNLLTSAIGTLSLMEQELVDPSPAPGGMSHATPLTGIRKDRKDDPQVERVRTALRACWQAAGLSRRLLNFASGAHGFPEVLSLRESVKLILDSFDPSYFIGIELRTDLADPVLVKMDRDQLTQVVLNLIRNACDAMPDGGELCFAVDSMTARNPEGEPDAPRRYAVLTVRDTGAGMSAAARKRVFEPFFTTKPPGIGRGRGMGMATVQAAVKGADGFIEFDSELGVGTTFRVYVPEAVGTPQDRETAIVGPGATPTDSSPWAAEGNILLVDDDPMVLPVCQEVLERWGYSVIAADSIVNAREKFASRKKQIPLAIIDMNLSEGAGVDLAKELVEMSPNLRIVFISGYAEKAVPVELEKHVCAQLAKPFRMEVLGEILAAALRTTVSEIRNATVKDRSTTEDL
ncbi:MAG: ATP-binding protein [Phycisphaerae bacterium]